MSPMPQSTLAQPETSPRPGSPAEGAHCQRRSRTLRGNSPRDPRAPASGSSEETRQIAGEKSPLVVGHEDLEVGVELKPVADGWIDPELTKFGGKYMAKFPICQVTIRCPTKDPLLILAMVYGFLVFVPIVYCGLFYLECGSSLALFGLGLSGCLTFVNELFLKRYFNEPRPWETANRDANGEPKPGMPSGHVLNSVSLLFWLVLEIETGCSATHSRASWVLGVGALMLPVPWARYYNRDHSYRQCVYTAMAAALVGMIAFLFRFTFFRRDIRAPWNM